jgi:hypothetical protein
MRKITQQSINAFNNAKEFKGSNTTVEVFPNVTVLKLFGNAIAYRYNDPLKELWITNAGWESQTTKERLNALDNVSIEQRKGVWYLDGIEWNGKLTKIS